MATSSRIPPLDWLMGFQRNVYRIEQIGMEFGYTRNDEDVRGNFTCREDGVRLWRRLNGG